jgi:hypothetical protein
MDMAFNKITDSLADYTLAKTWMRFDMDRIHYNTYNLGG